MKQVITGFMTLLLLTMISVANAAPSRFVEGVHYETLATTVNTHDPAKLEVREFFYYGCPACYNAEAVVDNWLQTAAEDVDFVRTPITFIRGSEPLARAYHVAVAADIIDDIHGPIFDGIHNHREQLFTKDALKRFFTKYGVEEEQFEKLYKSFGVNTRIRQGDTAAGDYRLTGVPAFTVNGKYVILRKNLRSEQETFQVINYLLNKERSAQ
ncbi:MAG TPA: thiol:disulfide interchange protein DsbA/DsbL [Alcanivoracaceae bacterium]|nr:thiol:disulfide interchange protein DsbA/DsbL [Alcanivoracaceae bacterium]